MILDKDVHDRPLPCKLMVDKDLHRVLKRQRGMLVNKYDVVIGVVGRNGVGKSWFSQQVGLAMDNNFSLDNIVFTDKQFYEAVDKLPKYSVIIYDEADSLSANHQDGDLKVLKRYMKRVRNKFMVIIFVTPTYRDMNYYFAISRMSFLFEIYDIPTADDDNPRKRGFWNAFNYDSKAFYYEALKKRIIVKGNKYKTLRGTYGKHPKGFPVDEDEYDNKKDEATQLLATGKREVQIIRVKSEIKKARSKAVKKIISWCASNHDIKIGSNDLAFIFDVNRETIRADKAYDKQDLK